MELCTLLPTPKLIQLDYLVASEALITLVAHTCQAEAACPGCGRASNLVQSRYTRTLADLPWHGIPVRLQLRLRRFFCDQRDCATTICTERLPALVKHYSRRTCRQAHTLDQIGYALGGEAGARLATSLGISISADTLLRRLHGRRPTRGPAPRVLGVDDWAFRKGHRYGTILVDLEQGCPIDLLPDRQGETLATWLKAHPGVEIIVRDRGGAYAEGARTGAPQAVQVADRFHLLKNLVEALEATLAQEQPALQEAAKAPTPAPELSTTGPKPAEPAATVPPDGRPAPPPRVAQQQAQRREQKRASYEAVQRLHAVGCTGPTIARQVGASLRTVRRYLRAPSFPERKPRTRPPGQLAPYRTYLEQRWREGCHNAAQLWRELREQGFRGSYASVYAWLAEWQAQLPPEQRRCNGKRPQPDAISPVPTPGAVVWWLLGRREKLSAEQVAYLERLTSLRPSLALAQELVQEFFALTGQRDVAALQPWRERVAASGVGELQRFSAGLQRDWEAVVAGLTREWSTGPVEGQINRLKMLKRQMYGRAGVSLLRARVLPIAATA
jgi:transposase